MGGPTKLTIAWDGRTAAEAEPRATPAWIWPNLLSLDAPLVAVAWELLFARLVDRHVAPAATAALALAVWLIYVADRLLDARKTSAPQDLAARHRFYQDHGWGFLISLLAVLPIVGWLAWTRLEPAVFLHGLWFLGAVAVYFGAVHVLPENHRRWFPKELAVAALFAGGCMVPVWQGERAFSAATILPWTLFLLVCWINSVTIEHTEWERLRGRRSDTPHPWSVALGEHQVAASAGLAATALVLLPVFPDTEVRWVLLAVALSAMGLAVLGARKSRLSADAVRVAADLVLLAPVLLLPFLF